MNKKPYNQDENLTIYNDFIKDLSKAFSSNSESFDKYAFTMSSTFFAVSVAFIDKVINLAKADCITLLYFSWGGFCMVIVISLASFLVSDAGLEDTLKKAEEYYLKNGRLNLDFANIYNRILKWMRITVFFLITFSLFTLLLFIKSNIKG